MPMECLRWRLHAYQNTQRVEQQMLKEDERDKHERGKLREQQVILKSTSHQQIMHATAVFPTRSSDFRICGCVIWEYIVLNVDAYSCTHKYTAKASNIAGSAREFGDASASDKCACKSLQHLSEYEVYSLVCVAEVWPYEYTLYMCLGVQ